MGRKHHIKVEFMDNLDRPESGPITIRVPDAEGLFIRVGGKPGFPVKSWQFRFHIGREVQGYISIGRYPTCSIDRAYLEAIRLQALVANGKDPRIEQPKPAHLLAVPETSPMTVNQLIDRYEANKMGHLSESTRKEYKRMLKKKVRDWVDPSKRLFGNRAAVDITFTDAEDLLNACRKKAERTATLVVIKMTNIWDYGVDIQILPDVRNIWSRQTKAPIGERDRRLSDAELCVLGNQLRSCGEPEEYVIAYQLFLLTGMRHTNLAHCRWEWVDLDSKWILIPKAHHKTGRKSKKPLQVFLSSYAVTLLNRLKELQDCDPDLKGVPWLFPHASDKTRPRDDLQDPWARITGQKPKPDKRRKAPVKQVAPLFGTGEDKECHIHDLRRTLASVLSDLGYKTYAGQILGHVTQGVTEIYTRTSSGPLLGMVEHAGRHIMTMMGFISPASSHGKIQPTLAPSALHPTPTYLFPVATSPACAVSVVSYQTSGSVLPK